MSNNSDVTMLRCSFCNKSQKDVRKLIAGPNVQICDECVEICLDLVNEDRNEDLPDEGPVAVPVGFVPSPGVRVLSQCSLCKAGVPVDHAITIHSLGNLCAACAGAVEAAIEAKRRALENQDT